MDTHSRVTQLFETNVKEYIWVQQ